MRILIVCSGNKNKVSPFIEEQVNALRQREVEVHYFLIKGKGIFGYLKNYFKLRKQIKVLKIDLVHAHYGLSALLCAFQKKVKFVITFHGSDINSPKILKYSKIAMKHSAENIFVSKELFQKSGLQKGEIIPCGIDVNLFRLIPKELAREKLKLEKDVKYVLFSSNFEDEVKNYPLAKKALALLEEKVQVIELKNYSREEVVLLLNAVDLALMTSLNEGSPQFIKEAIACNCPIVSTDVGDVRQNIENLQSCYITDFSPEDISQKIKLALKDERSNGRELIPHLNNQIIADRLLVIYKKLVP